MFIKYYRHRLNQRLRRAATVRNLGIAAAAVIVLAAGSWGLSQFTQRQALLTIASLERRLGLPVTVATIQAGWRKSRLTGVSIGRPALLDIAAVEVSLQPLAALFGGELIGTVAVQGLKIHELSAAAVLKHLTAPAADREKSGGSSASTQRYLPATFVITDSDLAFKHADGSALLKSTASTSLTASKAAASSLRPAKFGSTIRNLRSVCTAPPPTLRRLAPRPCSWPTFMPTTRC